MTEETIPTEETTPTAAPEVVEETPETVVEETPTTEEAPIEDEPTVIEDEPVIIEDEPESEPTLTHHEMETLRNQDVPDEEKGEPLFNKNMGQPDDDGGEHYNQVVQG